MVSDLALAIVIRELISSACSTSASTPSSLESDSRIFASRAV